MVDLNDAFDGKDPAFMDRLFPEGGWRRMLDESNGRLRDWGWFWNRFAPFGMLISQDPSRGPNDPKPAAAMPPALLKAVALGFLTDESPAATYKDGRGRVLRYWPLLMGNAPGDLLAYSDAVVAESPEV